MNKIKVRGRTVQGTWNYGNLATSQQKICNIDAGAYISNGLGLPFAYKVIVETVGQFVGLYDRNNTEIYEGDIIAKFDFANPNFRSVVVRHLGAFGYISDWDFIAFATNYHFKWVDGKSGMVLVIGNIHDNPELFDDFIKDKKEYEGIMID